MGDMGELYNARRAEQKRRHSDNRRYARALFADSGLVYEERNLAEAILLREPGKPKVDYYPSTGRWRVAGEPRTYNGGPEAFFAWYEKQVARDPAQGGKPRQRGTARQQPVLRGYTRGDQFKEIPQDQPDDPPPWDPSWETHDE